MSTGVLLTRAQPFHLGHVDVVRQALSDNDKVVIVVGSANKLGTKRNPFSIDSRLMMIDDMLKGEDLPVRRISVLPLADWSMEDAYKYAKEWGRFFYYNVVNKACSKEFTLYYNDSIEIVKNWFDSELLERITIKNSKRVRDVSATKVREAVLNEDFDYIRYAVGTLKYFRLMSYDLKHCSNEDFIMK